VLGILEAIESDSYHIPGELDIHRILGVKQTLPFEDLELEIVLGQGVGCIQGFGESEGNA
jgi:hypothetical protein